MKVQTERRKQIREALHHGEICWPNLSTSDYETLKKNDRDSGSSLEAAFKNKFRQS